MREGLSQAEPTSVGATLVVARLFSFAWSAPRRGRPQGTPLPSHMECGRDSGALTYLSP